MMSDRVEPALAQRSPLSPLAANVASGRKGRKSLLFRTPTAAVSPACERSATPLCTPEEAPQSTAPRFEHPDELAAPAVDMEVDLVQEEQHAAPAAGPQGPLVSAPPRPAFISEAAWAALQWRDAQASAAAYGAGLAVVCVLRGLALAASPTVVAAGSANALLWALMLRFGRSLLASTSAPSTPLLGEHAVLCAAQTAVRAINAAASALDGRDAMALLRASLLLRLLSGVLASVGFFPCVAAAWSLLFAAHPLLMADAAHPLVGAARTQMRAGMATARGAYTSCNHKRVVGVALVAAVWMVSGAATRFFVGYLAMLALRSWQQRDATGFAAAVEAAQKSTAGRAASAAARRVSLGPQRLSQLAAMLSPRKGAKPPAKDA